MTDEGESREKLLEEIAELRYRARVLSQLGAAIHITGPDDGTILYTNAQFDTMLGYEPGELAGNHISVVNAPGEKAPEETADDIMQCLNDTGHWSGEIKNIRKDGSILWCHAKVVEVDHPEHGRIWASVHDDITDRKRAEDALKLDAAILQNVPGGIYLVGLDDGIIKYANPRFERMFGYDPGEMVGKHVAIVNAPTAQTPEGTKAAIVGILRETEEWHEEIENVKKDGTRFWCQADVSLFDHPEFGRVGVSVHTDITDRKRAEEQLARAGQRWQDTFDAIDDMVMVVDSDHRVLQCNRAVRECFGELDLGSSRCFELFHGTREPLPGCPGVCALATGEPAHVEERGPAGEGRWYDIHVYPVKNEEGAVREAVHISKDITDRKRAEEALRQRTHDLGERVKELSCLYRLATLVEQRDVRLGDVLQGLVDIMPPAWQYPEVTCARITFEGTTFSTANFRESARRQTAAVSVHGEAAGEMTVCYLEEEPAADEGPFLAEERTLIDALAERLGRTVERIRAEEDLSADRERLRSLASELSLAEERERRRIAVGLHDNVTQDLIATAALLAQCPERMTEPRCAKCRDGVQELLAKAIRDVRTLTFELGSPILYELGLEAALEELVEEFQEKHGIRSEFEDDGKAKPLGPDLGALVFRAVRELLVNVVKHAKADKSAVSVKRDDEGLKVVVEDDGIGFDTAEAVHAAAEHGGFGLFGIRERLEYLGGGMRLESEPGRGARITLVVPLKDEQETDAEYSI